MCVLTLILENKFETKNLFQEKCEHGEMWENNFQKQFNSPRRGVTSKSKQKEKNARCIIQFQGFPKRIQFTFKSIALSTNENSKKEIKNYLQMKIIDAREVSI